MVCRLFGCHGRHLGILVVREDRTELCIFHPNPYLAALLPFSPYPFAACLDCSLEGTNFSTCSDDDNSILDLCNDANDECALHSFVP